MKTQTKILMAVLSLIIAIACSQENEGLNEGSTSTRQTKNTEGSKRLVDSIAADETGAMPTVTFYSIDEEDTVTVTPGESQTAQAPLRMELAANVNNPDDYIYICEWRIWTTNDNGSEETPLVTRFEDNTSYTLTKSGGYGVKLYVTFSLDGDTIEYESDPISIVISESKLTCPDGFSPNNDSINDNYRVTAQSIVKLDAKFFNRWGTLLHSATLENAQHVEGEPNKLILWDGKYKGDVVKDGIYLLHLEATGSDDLKYKIKKSISILTGFREGEETTTGGGGSSE